jgi:hypothetical protein
LLGLSSALWGIWGLITSANMVRVIAYSPTFWVAGLASSLIELALPALFAATMLGVLLGKGDDAQRASRGRKLVLAQAGVGVVAILVALLNVAVVLEIAPA